MDARTFLMLAMDALGGHVRGRTKVQKQVYFLGLLTGELKNLGYEAHYYGPYSQAVSNALSLLKNIGLVDESSSGAGAVNDMGFEVRRYDYTLNDDGRAVASQKERRQPVAWRRIQKAARRLRDAGDLDYMQLSVAAKTRFLLGKKANAATIEEITDLARRFGWVVERSQVEKAAKFLESLGLVRSSG